MKREEKWYKRGLIGAIYTLQLFFLVYVNTLDILLCFHLNPFLLVCRLVNKCSRDRRVYFKDHKRDCSSIHALIRAWKSVFIRVRECRDARVGIWERRSDAADKDVVVWQFFIKRVTRFIFSFLIFFYFLIYYANFLTKNFFWSNFLTKITIHV